MTRKGNETICKCFTKEKGQIIDLYNGLDTDWSGTLTVLDQII